jgi:hypothetical protein
VTNYAYKKDIPAANHNPSVDQPDMKDNTNAIANLIGEDHYTFGVANGGFHKQIRLPKLNTTADLSPRISNSGTLWTQVNTSVGASTETNLHYIPGTGANDYQLTRCIASGAALFGTTTQNYNGVGASYFGGWTFLPGGLLMQYGFFNNTGNPNPITFPVVFSNNPFSIQATLIVGSSGNNNETLSVKDGSVSPTGFQIVFGPGSSTDRKGLYWTAIGK